MSMAGGTPPRAGKNGQDGGIDNLLAADADRKTADDTPAVVAPADTDEAKEDETGRYFRGIKPDLLKAIQDDTAYRSEEDAAWFNLFDVLRKSKEADIDAASPGKVSYAQLFRQSAEYRGQLVDGARHGAGACNPAARCGQRLRRRATTTNAGLAPVDNPTSPLVVCCLELPEGFPVRDGMAEDVEVTGFFFKRWAYRDKEAPAAPPQRCGQDVQWQAPARLHARGGAAKFDRVVRGGWRRAVDEHRTGDGSVPADAAAPRAAERWPGHGEFSAGRAAAVARKPGRREFIMNESGALASRQCLHRSAAGSSPLSSGATGVSPVSFCKHWRNASGAQAALQRAAGVLDCIAATVPAGGRLRRRAGGQGCRAADQRRPRHARPLRRRHRSTEPPAGRPPDRRRRDRALAPRALRPAEVRPGRPGEALGPQRPRPGRTRRAVGLPPRPGIHGRGAGHRDQARQAVARDRRAIRVAALLPLRVRAQGEQAAGHRAGRGRPQGVGRRAGRSTRGPASADCS